MAGTVTVPTVTDGVTLLRPAVAPTRKPASADRAQLAALGEPTELLSELRAASREQPAVARAGAPGLLAMHATAAWDDQLDDLGIPSTTVTHAFETCRREIWLWVNGDRRWDQLATHLAQRVLRRAGRWSA